MRVRSRFEYVYALVFSLMLIFFPISCGWLIWKIVSPASDITRLLTLGGAIIVVGVLYLLEFIGIAILSD